jgi:hypothetical protein
MQIVLTKPARDSFMPLLQWKIYWYLVLMYLMHLLKHPHQKRDFIFTQIGHFMNGGWNIRNTHLSPHNMLFPSYLQCRDIQSLLDCKKNMPMQSYTSWASRRWCMNLVCIQASSMGNKLYSNDKLMTLQSLPLMQRQRAYSLICWVRNWQYQLSAKAIWTCIMVLMSGKRKITSIFCANHLLKSAVKRSGLGWRLTWCWPRDLLLFHWTQHEWRNSTMLLVTRISKAKQSWPRKCSSCINLVLGNLYELWQHATLTLHTLASNFPNQIIVHTCIITMVYVTPSNISMSLKMRGYIFWEQRHDRSSKQDLFLLFTVANTTSYWTEIARKLMQISFMHLRIRTRLLVLKHAAHMVVLV